MAHRLLIIFGLLILSFVIIFNLFIKFKQQSDTYALTWQKQSDVKISLSIGEFRFTLYGYSSPKSLVSISGMGIYDQTYSDETGYFQFKNRFSPLSPREACLTSKDQFGRISSPVCLPPFPIKYNVTIGPVLLSPTISLNTPLTGNEYYQGDEIILSGQTIPNSEVKFSTFIDEKKSLVNYLTGLIWKPAYAYTFPHLTTVADEKGNFSLSLPSSTSELFRIMAQTNYQTQESPESIKLHLKVLPVWMIIIKFFLFILTLLQSRLLESIITGEFIILAVYLLRRYLQPHTIARNRALALRQLYAIVKQETTIIRYK